MELKLRSEGTPINSEIYAESLAGTPPTVFQPLLAKRIDLIPLTAYF
jgi:hypothetical protein